MMSLFAGTDVEKDLERLEKRLQESIQGSHSELSRMSGHIIFSGGKRIRPAVGITVFKALGGKAIDSMIPVTVALELIHTATLIHDDIIDASTLRRVRAISSPTAVAAAVMMSRLPAYGGRKSPAPSTSTKVVTPSDSRKSMTSSHRTGWRRADSTDTKGPKAHLANGSLPVIDIRSVMT